MQKCVWKAHWPAKKATVKGPVPFIVVARDFVCPHLEVRFVSARTDTGRVLKVDVVSGLHFFKAAKKRDGQGMGEIRNTYRILVGKRRQSLEDSVKRILQKQESKDVD